ncbi:MAG: murein biosynthesis integral membrane protein MurJ [Candidatus Omnitrophica bacterium]|nr:murein biosynthesis integral membrane protein MurJ [Candidatus Omnitrophota bacterium]
MLKSSGAMGAATLSSRILGMVREIVYARFMGDGWVASAFVLALMIPNLFRRLLGEGALTAAFVPIFKAKEKTEGEREMWSAANAVISGLVVAASAITFLVVLGISLVLAMGWAKTETQLMLQLLRIMFPYMLLACLAAVFMSMLNARGFFFLPALGASLLNLVMIAAVLWLAPRFGHNLQSQIFALAIGILIAGLLQAGFQVPTLRRQGYRAQWVTPWGNETVREVLRKMVPGTIGVAAFQLNVLVTQGFAFWVEANIVASFNYAVRLMELPQGVFGISLATFMLPTLSGLAAEKKYGEFRATLRQGIGYLCFVNLLASALLVSLATPIIRLLFERGHFDAGSTHRAAFALTCLAPGLAAFSVVNVMARAFYALNDTKTPMLISIVCLGLNLVFSLWLVFPFKQGGLGIANTMSALFNVGLLFYSMRRKLRGFDVMDLKKPLLGMVAASVFAGGMAWGLNRVWENALGHTTLASRIGAVFAPMIAAGFLYFSIALIMGIPQAHEFLGLFRQKLRRPKLNLV